jgi:hypothetical protein
MLSQHRNSGGLFRSRRSKRSSCEAESEQYNIAMVVTPLIYPILCLAVAPPVLHGLKIMATVKD